MNKITVIPMGGLANRMRAIVSAYQLSIDTGYRLKIVWLANDELNCRFKDIFRSESLNAEVVEIKGTPLKYSTPLKRNLYIPALIYKFKYDLCLYPYINCGDINASLELKEKVMSNERILIISGMIFYNFNENLYRTLFVLQNEIKTKVELITKDFNKNTLGLHIRRGDNKMSIQKSPVKLFIQKVQDEIYKNEDANVYLATDDEKVKAQFIDKFGNRIITNKKPATRRTHDGILDAVAELYALATTPKFYGSYYSSFSDLVLILSHNDGEILMQES